MWNRFREQAWENSRRSRCASNSQIGNGNKVAQSRTGSRIRNGKILGAGRSVAVGIGAGVLVAGIEHVGLGCDFDGSVTRPFDAAHLSELTGALLQEGFSAAEIRAVMNGDLLRFFSEGLPHE
jgi:hypothetical protein